MYLVVLQESLEVTLGHELCDNHHVAWHSAGAHEEDDVGVKDRAARGLAMPSHATMREETRGRWRWGGTSQSAPPA